MPDRLARLQTKRGPPAVSRWEGRIIPELDSKRPIWEDARDLVAQRSGRRHGADSIEAQYSGRMPPRAGVDLGGTKIQTVVMDGRGKVLGQSRVPTPGEGPDSIVAVITQALRAAADEAGLATDSLIGVGVGAPGGIDPKEGILINPPNLPGFDGEFPLGPELEQRLGTRVELGNDVSVATEAEFRLGAGKPYESILGVFWGTGVGGGIILDGDQWV